MAQDVAHGESRRAVTDELIVSTALVVVTKGPNRVGSAVNVHPVGASLLAADVGVVFNAIAVAVTAAAGVDGSEQGSESQSEGFG